MEKQSQWKKKQCKKCNAETNAMQKMQVSFVHKFIKSLYIFWCSTIDKNTLYFRSWKSCTSSWGFMTVPQPPIFLMAPSIFSKCPAAQAPKIADPNKTDSDSSGHMTGSPATLAWVWTKSGFLLSPPQIKMDFIVECPEFCIVWRMCLVPY